MNRFEKWSLLVSLFLTGGSGIGLLWTKYLVRSDDPWAVINHPLQPLFLKVHIVVAPLLVFALGLVTTRHVLPQLRSRRRAGSGMLLILFAAPMIVTGYLIQTVIEPGWLSVLAAAHIGLGFLYLLGYAVHQARAAILLARSAPDGGAIRRAARAMTAVATAEIDLDRRRHSVEQSTKKLH